MLLSRFILHKILNMGLKVAAISFFTKNLNHPPI